MRHTVTLGPEERPTPMASTRTRQVLLNGTPIGCLVKQSAPSACEDRSKQFVPLGSLWTRTLGGTGKPIWRTWTEARKALQAQVEAINQ